jgi:hypothetical protein
MHMQDNLYGGNFKRENDARQKTQDARRKAKDPPTPLKGGYKPSLMSVVFNPPFAGFRGCRIKKAVPFDTAF